MAFFIGFKLRNNVFVSISCPDRKASFLTSEVKTCPFKVDVTGIDRNKEADYRNITNAHEEYKNDTPDNNFFFFCMA
ncbi:hypothetical protein BWI96_14070 [Siphonobacter sp. SORGH_AS_0500]|nr:hypothetical protein BWI96_14070 [Siphonobacter sp. SORGH_AS_0500]